MRSLNVRYGTLCNAYGIRSSVSQRPEASHSKDSTSATFLTLCGPSGARFSAESKNKVRTLRSRVRSLNVRYGTLCNAYGIRSSVSQRPEASHSKDSTSATFLTLCGPSGARFSAESKNKVRTLRSRVRSLNVRYGTLCNAYGIRSSVSQRPEASHSKDSTSATFLTLCGPSGARFSAESKNKVRTLRSRVRSLNVRYGTLCNAYGIRSSVSQRPEASHSKDSTSATFLTLCGPSGARFSAESKNKVRTLRSRVRSLNVRYGTLCNAYGIRSSVSQRPEASHSKDSTSATFLTLCGPSGARFSAESKNKVRTLRSRVRSLNVRYGTLCNAYGIRSSVSQRPEASHSKDSTSATFLTLCGPSGARFSAESKNKVRTLRSRVRSLNVRYGTLCNAYGIRSSVSQRPEASHSKDSTSTKVLTFCGHEDGLTLARCRAWGA